MLFSRVVSCDLALNIDKMFARGFLLLCVIVATLALPLDNPNEVKIVKQESELHEDGSYRFYYETSDGQKREETGTVYKVEGEEPTLVVNGVYSYIGPDGVTYTVTYTADQNGFNAEGDHIPTAGGEAQATLPPPMGLPPNAINSLLG